MRRKTVGYVAGFALVALAGYFLGQFMASRPGKETRRFWWGTLRSFFGRGRASIKGLRHHWVTGQGNETEKALEEAIREGY